MINTGLKNENKVSELLISGSLAIKTKNESGVHVFEDKNTEAGIISGKLTKPKYDEDEILKSIDTTIIELLPIDPPPLDDTVPRPVYNEVTQSVIDLTAEVTRLNEIVLDLTAKVSELEIVTQSLRIELDNASLNVAQAQNNAAQIGLKIETSVVDLSNAIQKATSEAIQRVSLAARIASLEEQNREFKEKLDGKDAKLAEGSKVGMEISLKVLKKADEAGDDILFNTRPGKDKGNVNWINGPDVEVYNFGNEPVNVSFESSGETKDALQAPASFTLEAKAKKIIILSTNKDKVKDIKNGRDKLYKGSLIAKTPSSSITLTVGLQLQRGNKFSP